jgi:uncharacterized protein YqjF (DUF2071 family)
MHQRWHHLLFLHWKVPAETLRPLVPERLTLDTFQGEAWVGLIPFTMTHVRPVGLPPLPAISAFHEMNVRTYVHLDGRDPGVWFFSLDAAGRAAVLAARATMGLPYFFADMSMTERNGAFDYTSKRRWPGPKPAEASLRYRGRGSTRRAAPGALEHFLIERYILYSMHLGRLLLGRVHHRPYPLEDAEVSDLSESVVAAASIARPNEPPLAHYARGVDVEVFAPRVQR